MVDDEITILSSSTKSGEIYNNGWRLSTQNGLKEKEIIQTSFLTYIYIGGEREI